MSEKRLLRLSNWNKGMNLKASRSDLPPDMLWYAENVDLSVPLRQGFYEQDALLGDADNVPNPDHNLVAVHQDYNLWQWCGTGLLGTFQDIFTVTFADTAFLARVVKTAATFKLDIVGTTGDSSWANIIADGDLDFIKNGNRQVFSTGKYLLAPHTDDYLISAWDATGTWKVGNVSTRGIITVDVHWTANSPVTGVEVELLNGRFARFLCVKTPPASEPGDAAYLTNDDAEYENVFDSRPAWCEWWTFTGTWDVTDVLYATYDNEIDSYIGRGSITLTIGTINSVYTASPTTIETEFIGRPTGAFDGVTLSDTNYIRPLPYMDNADWPLTNAPRVSSQFDSLTSNLDLQARGIILDARLINIEVPDDGTPPAKDWRTPLMRTPRWVGAGTATYYAACELENGGWSRPEELFSTKIDSPEERHSAVGLMFFSDLSRSWSEGTGAGDAASIRAVHIFRSFKVGNEAARETWLFSADRENSQWLQGVGSGDVADVYGLSVGTVTDGDVDSTAHKYDGDVLEVQEAVATPGLSISLTFNEVTEIPERIRLRAYTDAPHEVYFYIWDYSGGGSWTAIADLTLADNGTDFVDLVYDIPDGTNFVSGNQSQVLFYYAGLGDASHKIYVDWAAIQWDNANDSLGMLAPGIFRDPTGSITAEPDGRWWISGAYMPATSIPETLRVHNDDHKRSAITLAFQDLAKEEGVNLAPMVSAGGGLFAYVDDGDDTSGETAETVIGVTLANLIGPESIDPTDLTLIGVALGRAFYTDATNEIVYFSEIDKYSIVNPLSKISRPNTGSLNAVESLHGFIALMFEHKFVVIDARSGVDLGWSLVLEADGIGCYSAKTVSRHNDRFYWIGSGAVWTWNGVGKPEKISKAIEFPELTSAMTQTNIFARYRCWTAVDPIREDLIVYLARAEAGSYSVDSWKKRVLDDVDAATGDERGKAFIYHIPTKTWPCFELFRAFVDTSNNGYMYLGKPFVLDNYLLIPTTKIWGTVGGAYTDFKYLIVRQAYNDFLAGGAAAHDSAIPALKRQVLETGFLDLGTTAQEKKLKRLHAAFSGEILPEGCSSISGLLDHWTIELHTFQGWEDTFPDDYASLADRTADYTWDVSAEDSNKGYDLSVYRKNDLPSRQFGFMGLYMESSAIITSSYETRPVKAELNNLEISFKVKRKV